MEYYLLGLLPAVGTPIATPNLLNSTISLTWTPPFSLDITGVHPDIIYCVGVVNSTSSLVIYSQCDITEAQYNYTVSPRSTPCDTYTVTVTPVNIVGNGTSSNVTLLSSITMGEIRIIIIVLHNNIILIAPQPIESGDLRDIVQSENSIFFYYGEVSIAIIVVHSKIQCPQ